LSQYLYGDKTPLWSSSYFLATTGSTVMEKVKDYINSQRTDDHKRKYEKTGKYSKKKSRS
ncbi:MAG: transposase, partial [Clostridiales bacterium]|nr:transposase [Clostridiales bacterium]